MHQSVKMFMCLGLTIAGLCWAKTFDTKLKEVSDPKYKPGQVWSYTTRPGEEQSTLTILRIEELSDKKRIVHIRVDHIRLKNCTGGPEPNVLHMPFARYAVDASVVKIIRSGDVPDYQEGYSEWRKARDTHNAGFYTSTVAGALDVLQETFRQGLGCPRESS